MKCTGKNVSNRIRAFLLSAVAAVCLTGCGGGKYELAYRVDSEVSSFNVLSFQDGSRAAPFTKDLCVVAGDVAAGTELDMSQAEAALLIHVNNREALYAKNAHGRMHPASLTAVMTALVALKNGSPEQVLTATDAVKNTEAGAQLVGLNRGDVMTLDQALHILLLSGASDVALLIADNIGGSVDGFLKLMNEEALRLGATNTHFANPHGLTDEAHYTTAYDLYLMFNEAIRYESINEIIHMSTYRTAYHDKLGAPKEVNCKNSNSFLNGGVKPPDNVTVIGGKTGTTSAAGSCLVLLSKDVSGAPYISIVLKAQSKDALYTAMGALLATVKPSS